MSYILQVDFPYNGPWGEDMYVLMEGIARSIAKEPGLIWKVWTVNEQQQEAGGIYLFSDEPSAIAYLEMHSSRLQGFGISDIKGKVFAVHQGLTELDHGPI
ncbi:monooxygenase [Pseudomonas sp. CFBP 8770]|nr:MULTISPECIES: monooxygenase [unclassified Pseudomonas]MBD8473187.1 monooxygenase [Pseudomonas sp. CFBP 8773]MBD8595927.1 monooxygenase [Pseudomonas sp. CFBP 8758]MBD8646314.1 monooxygenase [Pseudomonas sp. CFBP 8770]MBD8733534.1 monooxygenase [Pseudomonas sp. CFBP 13710]